MKIHAWFSRGLCPLDMLEQDGLFSLFFQDEEGETSDRVLLTGISGVGKSTLLQAIGDAWAGLEDVLADRVPQHPVGNAALGLEDLLETPVLLCYAPDASFWDALAQRYPEAGMVGVRNGELCCPPELRQALSARMADPATRPNILSVTEDAQPATDGALTGYTVTLQQVQAHIRAMGGLPQALQEAARLSPERAADLRTQVNALLYGKQLEGGQQQYRVLTRRGAEHAPEALSTGERRILLLLFSVWTALHPGGILLLDEPESHLHPSQVLGLLSTLEEQIAAQGGQLMLSSHAPQVWRRYEVLGLVIQLEGRA